MKIMSNGFNDNIKSNGRNDNMNIKWLERQYLISNGWNDNIEYQMGGMKIMPNVWKTDIYDFNCTTTTSCKKNS